MKIRSKLISFLHHFKKRFTKRSKQFVYVAIGDSTVEGSGASTPNRAFAGIILAALRENQKHVELFNLGKSGATIDDVLTQQLEKTIQLKPNLITISVGANDILKKTPMNLFKNRLQTLLDTLKAQTDAEIVINNIPDMSYAPAVPFHLKHLSKFLVVRLNKQIAYYAYKAKVILVDVYTHTKIYMKYYPELVSKDGFHPSDFGYALWANIILGHIQHILLKQSTFLPS